MKLPVVCKFICSKIANTLKLPANKKKTSVTTISANQRQIGVVSSLEWHKRGHFIAKDDAV